MWWGTCVFFNCSAGATGRPSRVAVSMLGLRTRVAKGKDAALGSWRVATTDSKAARVWWPPIVDAVWGVGL